jgi:hypothetical protein
MKKKNFHKLTSSKQQTKMQAITRTIYHQKNACPSSVINTKNKTPLCFILSVTLIVFLVDCFIFVSICCDYDRNDGL